MTVTPDAITPEPDTDVPVDPSFDDTDTDEDDDDEDIASDAVAALRDMVGPKRVPNGVYNVVHESTTYTEIPRAQGRPYLTFSYLISTGPYKGKRITTRFPVV